MQNSKLNWRKVSSQTPTTRWQKRRRFSKRRRFLWDGRRGKTWNNVPYSVDLNRHKHKADSPVYSRGKAKDKVPSVEQPTRTHQRQRPLPNSTVYPQHFYDPLGQNSSWARPLGVHRWNGRAYRAQPHTEHSPHNRRKLSLLRQNALPATRKRLWPSENYLDSVVQVFQLVRAGRRQKKAAQSILLTTRHRWRQRAQYPEFTLLAEKHPL